ncbi:MAG: hypothetical protein CR955_01715, partial [Thiotrichales bacterium]
MKFLSHRLMNSLSVKLVVIFFVTSVALTGLLWWSLDISFERQFSETIKPYFSNYIIELKKELGSPPDVAIAKKITQESPVNIVIEAPTYRWSSNGDFIEKPYLDIKVQRLGTKGLISEVGFYKGNFILRTFNQGYITSFIITDKLERLPKFEDILLIFFIGLLVVSAVFWLIHWLFSPVEDIRQGLKHIGAGDIKYRLDIRRDDELGELATAINEMSDNIEQMLEAKRQLLLAISHELRTPITRAKLALSLLDDNENIDSVSEGINEMERLIWELLESERLREKHTPLELNTVNINEIIYQVQGRFFADAPLELHLTDGLSVQELDAGRMSLAIKNIIKNALTASNDGDSVIVTTKQTDSHTIINIKDNGMGIDKKLIPHLTEPFYRTDRSR